MAQNVEIKAKARNWAQQIATAAGLASDGPHELHQRDVFFEVPEGRLKLRTFGAAAGELIAYRRPDQSGPKLSQYQISPTNDAAALEKALSLVMPVLGVVEKKRTLYWVDRTRIHLDEVVGLGRFLELEVVLKSDESAEQGQLEARRLTEQLGIQETDLLQCAYLDLIRAAAPPAQWAD